MLDFNANKTESFLLTLKTNYEQLQQCKDKHLIWHADTYSVETSDQGPYFCRPVQKILH